MEIIAKAIDTIQRITPNTLEVLKQNGVTAVARYLGYTLPSLQWKAMSKEEALLITGSGLKLVSIWERLPTSVDQFTVRQALLDARDAVVEAEALGQPHMTPILFTVDFDAQPADLPAIISYFKTLTHAVENYKVAVYGGFRVLEAIHNSGLPISGYCQTVAWQGNNGVVPYADMYQDQENTSIGHLPCDIDQCFTTSLFWEHAPKEVMYPTLDVEINGSKFPYKGIVVNGSTYVLWSALEWLGTPFTKDNDTGLFTVNGSKVQGIVNGGKAYLPWTSLAPGVKDIKTPTGWNFVYHPSEPPATKKAVSKPPTPSSKKKEVVVDVKDSSQVKEVEDLAKKLGDTFKEEEK